MKKAKVKCGVVQFVWPYTKTLPDGTVVVKECPYEDRGKPLPDCIIDVEDHVKAGMVWNEDLQDYITKAEFYALQSKAE